MWNNYDKQQMQMNNMQQMQWFNESPDTIININDNGKCYGNLTEQGGY